MAFCNMCGTEVNEGTKFCSNCGNTVSASKDAENAVTLGAMPQSQTPAYIQPVYVVEENESKGKTKKTSLAMPIIAISISAFSLYVLLLGVIIGASNRLNFDYMDFLEPAIFLQFISLPFSIVGLAKSVGGSRISGIVMSIFSIAAFLIVFTVWIFLQYGY